MALEARIKQLLALDENRKCADCGTRSPRWASYSLGVFMCLQCAGFHRALGVHISRVKSCDLDRWTEDQVRAMEAVGNARGREEYGPSYAEVNNTTSLPDAASLETFIRSKYARRLYAKGGFGASFNTPEAAAAASRKPQQDGGLWADGCEPAIDTTSKIRIDWPRKTLAAAAYPLGLAATTTQPTPQKEPSLIDLFEPAPVVQQVQQQQPAAAAAAAPVDPFFADFAAAPVAAAAATAAPAADLFDLMPAVAAPKQLSQQSFASFPLQQLQPQQSQQSFASFPLQQLQPQQSQLAFDDDFGDFVVAAVAAKRSDMQQQAQPTSLLDFDTENVPPPLPAKDYSDPFLSVAQPPPLPAKDYASPAACAVDTALAGLFASSLTTLAPVGVAAPAAAPPAAAVAAPTAPRMSTSDIMALYGGGGGAGAQSTAMPAFPTNFGGPGASWA